MTPADVHGDLTYNLAIRLGVLEEARESFEDRVLEAVAGLRADVQRSRGTILIALLSFAGPVTAAVIAGAIALLTHHP